MTFKEFMAKWAKKATAPDIRSDDWHENMKQFWLYVRSIRKEELDVNLKHIPFSIRWSLSERFPELTKELLIDARSFESLKGVNGGWHMVYGQDKIYLKSYLIRYVFKSHNTYHLAVLKPLILEFLDYEIS